MQVHRVFRADLRRPGPERKEAHQKLLGELRKASWLCAQFGNEVLTANYLLYRHRKEDDPLLFDALSDEQKEADLRYRNWADRLSSYARDAIGRAVSGLIRARGREVMRGECSLPTFHRRGAIRVRDRGVRLFEQDGKLFAGVCVEPKQWIEMELWVKNLHKSPQYRAVLDNLLSGEYKIGQAQVLIVDGHRVSLRFLYSAEVKDAEGGRVGEVVPHETGIALQVGQRVYPFEFDVQELSRRKETIEARRVQCWRLLRGRRLRKRRARIYRSGTLRKLSAAWMMYQRTWCQQLGAAIAKRCRGDGVSRLAVPTAGKFGEAFTSVIDFGQMSQAITNACTSAGIEITQIAGEKEQAAALRKEQAKEARKSKASGGNSEGLQSGV